MLIRYRVAFSRPAMGVPCGSAQGVAELAAALGRGAQRVREQLAQAVSLEVRDGGFGGAALGSDVGAQLGDVLAGALGHAAGADERALGEQLRGRGIEAERG